MMKSTFQKKKPNFLNYRNYKFFNNGTFKNDLFHEIQSLGIQNIECEQFEILFMKILNYHAPQKTRLVRANNSPFMTKELYKAIMTRSRLRNKFLKLKTTESNNAYKKQRNYCVSLLNNKETTVYLS